MPMGRRKNDDEDSYLSFLILAGLTVLVLLFLLSLPFK